MAAPVVAKSPASDKAPIWQKKGATSMVQLMSVQREGWRVKEARECCDLEGVDDYEIVQVMESTGYDPVKYIPLLVARERKRKPEKEESPRVHGLLQEKAKQLRETVTMSSKRRQELKITLPELSERGTALALRWMLTNLNRTVNYKISMMTSNPQLVQRILTEKGYTVERRKNQILLDLGPDLVLTSSDGQPHVGLGKDWRAFFESEIRIACESNDAYGCDVRVSVPHEDLTGNVYSAYAMLGQSVPEGASDVQAVLCLKYEIFRSEQPVKETRFSKLQNVTVNDLKEFKEVDGRVRKGAEQHLFAWHLVGLSPTEMRDRLLSLKKNFSNVGLMKYWCQWISMFPRDFATMDLPESIFDPPDSDNTRKKSEWEKWTRLWCVFTHFASQFQALDNSYRLRLTGDGIAKVMGLLVYATEMFADHHARMLRSITPADIVAFLTNQSVTAPKFIVTYFTMLQETVNLVVESLSHRSDIEYKQLLDFWLGLAGRATMSARKNYELGFAIALGLGAAAPYATLSYRKADIEKHCALFNRAGTYKVLTDKMKEILEGSDRTHIICIFPYLLWLVWLKDKLVDGDGNINVQNVSRSLELTTAITCGWGIVRTKGAVDMATFLRKHLGPKTVLTQFKPGRPHGESYPR